MENIERILQLLKESRLHKSKEIYILDDITPEIAEAHRKYAQFGEDEKLLFAFQKKPNKSFCITDKRLYAKSRALQEKSKGEKFGVGTLKTVVGVAAEVVGLDSDKTDDLIDSIQDSIHDKKETKCYNIALEDINSISLGEFANGDSEMYAQTGYKGHILNVNEEQVGMIYCKTSNGSFGDDSLWAVQNIQYLFKAMSGEINMEDVVKEFANAPEKPIKPNVGWLVYQVYAICSLGIFHLVQMYNIQRNINTIASKYDGQTTQNYFKAFLIGILTLSIYWFVWRHKLLKRVEAELKRREIEYADSFSATKLMALSCWGIMIFPPIILVGPFIYIYKLLKAMNFLVADYNIHG